MLRRVALLWTGVSEERSAPTIRVKTLNELKHINNVLQSVAIANMFLFRGLFSPWRLGGDAFLRNVCSY
jgi:hypothetical protein